MRHQPLSVLLIVFASFAAGGCTSWRLSEPEQPRDAFDPSPPELAQICVFRRSLLAQAVTFPVHDNGVLVGATRGRSHFCYHAAPGRHVIAIKADKLERAEIVAEPGGRYYLEQEVYNTFGHVTCRAVWVADSVAAELVEASTYRVLVGVPGSERLPGEVPFAPAEEGDRARSSVARR
ncbi:hypothetical protein [Nannocystis radixulma]|uniref:DUF2846 domain-containing protein n=1 Tax=Nannocystis radixulma TaxID=2995305 RepID=A0ABT5BEP8_9BACT|nr:hypothetical protein [Nannocystis radixulma]MDC0672611.1 hypothetical protein [Nannocystis radixulma]